MGRFDVQGAISALLPIGSAGFACTNRPFYPPCMHVHRAPGISSTLSPTFKTHNLRAHAPLVPAASF